MVGAAGETGRRRGTAQFSFSHAGLSPVLYCYCYCLVIGLNGRVGGDRVVMMTQEDR